ncbi:tryptophan synthase subunit alpha, partial [Campylobacter jejuni]|uniref:tryptophan synthase subunit alpha n=1 Tax=Campylobacter jejuni TaxID=197 RepID=UPI0018F87455
SKPVNKECKKYDIALSTLVSIKTPKERVKELVKNAKGFIYLLASVDITGGQSADNKLLQEKIQEIQSFTKLPIYVGFGVKNNADVKSIRKIAEGVIVGTNIVKLFASNDIKQILKGVEEIFEK